MPWSPHLTPTPATSPSSSCATRFATASCAHRAHRSTSAPGTEFQIRLGLELLSKATDPATLRCQRVGLAQPIRVPKGATLTLAGSARLSTLSDGVQTSPWVPYQGGSPYFPMGLKSVLTDLDLRVAAGALGPVAVCVTR